jgi:hypothetical protein
MSEKELQGQILNALATLRGVDVWRQNTGMAKANGFRIRYGHVGSGDISGLIRGGRRLEIEVKTAKGIVSPEQEAFGARINGLGGLWFVARSVEDAVSVVMAALREGEQPGMP